jgi:hypothetical protein
VRTQFLDRQDPSSAGNGRMISNSAELRSALESVRGRPPFFVELVGENGFKLLLGLGPTEGCAQFSPADGSVPYLMAVAPSGPEQKGEASFLINDTPTPVPRCFCMPLEMVVDIADVFVNTGGRKADVAWEEI